MGKLSRERLKKLLSCIKKDSRVVVPPTPGFDSGVHMMGDKYVVVATDPCIGVPEEWFGWLLIHYAASDVALFGATPEFCTINLLGSASTKPAVFHKIMRQACYAADELQVTIVCGHTGTYRGLSTLVGVCTAYGTISKEKLITPNGAKPGDYILCTKPIGLETAVNFALTHKAIAERLFGLQRTREVTKFIDMQSCVREALLLAGLDGVHALHDATEGGLIAALNELAEASSVGLEIEPEKIQIPREVKILAERFRLSQEQVLSMSSTGTILAAVSPKAIDVVEETLRQHKIYEARVIGVFTRDKHRTFVKHGGKTSFPKEASDPYVRILSGKL